MAYMGGHGLIKGGQGVASGDPLKAIQGFGKAAGAFLFRSNVCGWSNGLACNGVRGLELGSGAIHGGEAIGHFLSGDALEGTMSAAQALFLVGQGSRACFSAGTPLISGGSKAIETFRSFEEHGDDCDLVLSRNENDPDSPLAFKRVLRTFVRELQHRLGFHRQFGSLPWPRLWHCRPPSVPDESRRANLGAWGPRMVRSPPAAVACPHNRQRTADHLRQAIAASKTLLFPPSLTTAETEQGKAIGGLSEFRSG
jgi:hypothetical protein